MRIVTLLLVIWISAAHADGERPHLPWWASLVELSGGLNAGYPLTFGAELTLDVGHDFKRGRIGAVARISAMGSPLRSDEDSSDTFFSVAGGVEASAFLGRHFRLGVSFTGGMSYDSYQNGEGSTVVLSTPIFSVTPILAYDFDVKLGGVFMLLATDLTLGFGDGSVGETGGVALRLGVHL